MGFLSKVWKGIKKGAKKIWKGAKKLVKKTFKFAKKVWDKFRESSFGKVIMVAAAVYFGGVALGAWKGVGAAAANAGTGVMSTLGTTAPITSSGVAGAGLAAPAGGSLLSASMPAVATSAVPSGLATAASSAAPSIVGAGSTLSFTEQLAAATKGIAQTAPTVAKTAPTGIWDTITDYGGKALNWMEKNPELTKAAGNAITAMTQEDQYDMWRKQQEYLRNNSNIAGVNGDGSGQPVGLGLIKQAQMEDLYTPTYQAGGG